MISCRACGSKDVRCSRNTGLLWGVLKKMALVPYRCRSCRACFLRSGSKLAAQTSRHRLQRFGFSPMAHVANGSGVRPRPAL